MNHIAARELDRIHNILLAIYFAIFLLSRANQIRYLVEAMADTLVPQTPPKKLFKPATKTKTPTRMKPSPQSQHSAQSETSNPTHGFNSPIDIAKYFKDQGNPEMSSFVTSLMDSHSSESSENTPKVTKSPAGEEQSSNNQTNDNDNTGDQKNLGESDQAPSKDKLEAAPASVSKTADGTFRDTERDNERDTSAAQPTNKMGDPNVANISKAAQPAVPGAKSDNKASSQRPQINGDGQEKDSHVIDNMGRPAHVERRIEIPLQRQSKDGNGSKLAEAQKSKTGSKDLGDFEDLPSTNDLPDIPNEDSPDPPEEILDPSVHSTEAANITPIPKIPKIPHIDSLAPFNLQRLAEGLAGHEIDDVGNIVDESGEVLGHATGDLPAMVGKKVSENGEVYGDDGEIVGYVSDNFINPPSPTEIPGDVIGGLRVDHKGNILDQDGNIIGKFNRPLGNNNSSSKPSHKNDSEGKPKEEQKPKVNAQNGGSPSDLFLDVKSTNDGIQLTIRIPTTFSRPSPES
ncbi:hypothetical protein F5B22DRAFT_534610 [Xylaria bambusicola]|uniref:uncharacterized protein n=1 Tax=Xylaria bambusicola TaxID=326684 RepID=UPI0020074B0A|nr:uncharacterized protein F5B22DRAFT_534610 [Xylaria bambusicola]KAI0505232.1 hypothetical protein F5B22DRAFT_534610 [Xylaria bambusicola]